MSVVMFTHKHILDISARLKETKTEDSFPAGVFFIIIILCFLWQHGVFQRIPCGFVDTTLQL